MGIKRTSCNSDYFFFESNLYPEDILFSLAASQTTHSHISFHSVHDLKQIFRNPAYLPVMDCKLHASFWENWHQGSTSSETYTAMVLKINNKIVLTFAFSMTFANSPTHKKHKCGVNNRKQSPLFSDEALGSTNLVWTCLLPTEKRKLIIFLWLPLSNATIWFVLNEIQTIPIHLAKYVETDCLRIIKNYYCGKRVYSQETK